MGENKREKSGQAQGRHGRSMIVEKPKDFKGTLRRLASYLADYRGLLFLVLLFSILSTVFSVFSPKVLALATDKLMEGAMAKLKAVEGASIDFKYIGNILLILGVMYFVSAIFMYIQRYIMVGVGQGVVFK